jgi:uncharacterized protein (DUF2141 family)
MRALFLAGATSVAIASIGTVAAQTGNDITVAVDGLRNDQGIVRCGLYNSPNGFREPGKEFKGTAAKISGGKANCVFNNVPAGTYAVALFHAEHNETQLETGMFGIPKQGYGFTRDAKGSMGPPSFNAAAYAYQGGTSTWPVKIQY